jgi:methylglyoxal synthase
MDTQPNDVQSPKNIALIAHDNKKDDLLAWAKYNLQELSKHRLYATGTTGKLLSTALNLDIKRMQSGPLGGDMQIGALIASGNIDILIFFWDPLESMPHDPDIKALLRLAVVWNIPVAMNRSSADFLFSSPLMEREYTHRAPDYGDYKKRINERFEDFLDD